MLKKLAGNTTLLAVLSVFCAAAASAQSNNPPCVRDKKYDAVLSAAMPPAEYACRAKLSALEQSECSDATFKRDWNAFVTRRKARLELYEKEMVRMTGGNQVGNLMAMKAYADGGYVAMDAKVIDKPSACVLKRRTVADEALDFTPISNHMGLWVAASGKLIVSENRKAYGPEVKCRLAQTTYAYQRAEVALELIKKAPAAPPPDC